MDKVFSKTELESITEIGLKSEKFWNTKINSTNLEKSIATKWHQAMETHECSWDIHTSTYTSQSPEDLFISSLTDEELSSPLTHTIMTFFSHGNDMEELLNRILGTPYVAHKLIEFRKTLPY